jgi:hypothetical protein
VIAKTAHIGRIIVSLPGSSSVANFSRASEFRKRVRMTKSGTALSRNGIVRAQENGSSERAWDHRSIELRLLCLKPDRSRHLKFFIEKSGKFGGRQRPAEWCTGEDEPRPRIPDALAVLDRRRSREDCEIFLRHLTR